MKASIIIPNLNGEGWIKDSIDSCINQDFKEEYEIIIIDNGSKDRSVEIIEECATRFKNFKIIKFRENTGFSYAVNRGIEASDGEYAVLFNNDAFAQPDWLSQLVAVADTDEKIFSVGSLMVQHFHRDLADDAGIMFPFSAGPAKGVTAFQKTDTQGRRGFFPPAEAPLYTEKAF